MVFDFVHEQKVKKKKIRMLQVVLFLIKKVNTCGRKKMNTANFIFYFEIQNVHVHRCPTISLFN